MTTATSSATAWEALSDHLNQWFHKPDLEALAAALAVGSSHSALASDPVWLFVIGPSGSGKTSIIINSLAALPQAHILGDIGPHTFISHVQGRGSDHQGLLTRVGSGVLLFKDFTTFLSKREDERNEIAAQLREIHDGRIVRESGVALTDWQGKMTVVAAATPALERAWSVKRELGERFVTVRWPRIGGIALAGAAARQSGQEKQIATATRSLAAAFCAHRATSLPLLSPMLADRLAYLSEMVATLRGHVVRDSYGKREIIDYPSIEEPGRLNKSLSTICASHAALWQRDSSEADYAIAARVAWDSIPYSRAQIVKCLPSHGTRITRTDLRQLTGAPESSIRWQEDELEALGVVTIFKMNDGESYVEITQDFGDLLSRSRLRER